MQVFTLTQTDIQSLKENPKSKFPRPHKLSSKTY